MYSAMHLPAVVPSWRGRPTGTGTGWLAAGTEEPRGPLSPLLQLKQMEVQLEEEYEEKQKVLREKRELESKLGLLSDQVGQRHAGSTLGGPRGAPGLPAAGVGVQGELDRAHCHPCGPSSRPGDSSTFRLSEGVSGEEMAWEGERRALTSGVHPGEPERL